jgi:uncharacterized protein involved in tellurium resistance
MKKYGDFNKLNENQQLDSVLGQMLDIQDKVTGLVKDMGQEFVKMKKEHVSLKNDYNSLKKLVYGLRDELALEEPEIEDDKEE